MSTVTVVPTVEASNTPPRIRLDVTDTGSPNLFAATVTRLNPDGSVVAVRTSDGDPLTLTTSGANRIGTLYDYEMPYGAAVSYSSAETPGSSSGEVTVDVTDTWLIHVGVPELSTTIRVAQFGDRSRAVQRSVLRPMGRKYPVVRTDGARGAAEYVLAVHTFTDVERAALDAILEDAGTLLLNVPATNNFGVTAEYVDIGDMTEVRPVRFAGESLRTWSLACTVVDSPTGGSQAERTLADLMVYATLADLQAAYPTLADVLAGP